MRSERADLLRRLIDKMTEHRTKFNGNGWAYDNLPVRDVLLLLNFIPEGDLLQSAPDRENLMKKLYEMSTQEPCGDDVPSDSGVIVEAIAYIGTLESLIEDMGSKKHGTYDKVKTAISEIEATIDKNVVDPKAREFARRRLEWLLEVMKDAK